jgi:N-terminal domain of toast_rack, DUF2154/Cell wall-active antibiotics response 4TMS YvqF
MGRVAVLFVAAVAVAVLIGACDAVPQRVEVGELRTETRSVEVEGADSVRANVRIALGELDVGSGAGDRLMQADFAYNVAAWQPRVDYEVVGNSGELTVQQQGLDEGIPTTDVRNEWDLRLNEAVPVDLAVQMGGGVGNLDLDSLALRRLNLDVGAGATRVDLSGDWGQDVSAVVRGGAGQVTMLLPSRMGVRVNAGTRLGRINAEGLRKEGEAFVNDAYGDSDATLEVDITGGAGQINLQVVQQEGGEETTAQQAGTTMMQEETTVVQEDTAQEETTQGGDTTMMQGGTTDQEDAAIGLSAVIEDPQRYYGQTTTVSGAVGQVIEPRAFVMVDEQTLQGGPPSEAELVDRGVLVVRTGGPAPNVSEPQKVRVTGTLQQFDIATLEQQQGVDLDDALYAEYQDSSVLVAAEVQPTQGEGTPR